jgi:crotonobetainyl-CoA:carnitine CoA-transferase CaiB-like acyl-CoA transferase
MIPLLKGLLILDLTSVILGPYATQAASANPRPIA